MLKKFVISELDTSNWKFCFANLINWLEVLGPEFRYAFLCYIDSRRNITELMTGN
jgi:hypothetical protein